MGETIRRIRRTLRVGLPGVRSLDGSGRRSVQGRPLARDSSDRPDCRLDLDRGQAFAKTPTALTGDAFFIERAAEIIAARAEHGRRALGPQLHPTGLEVRNFFTEEQSGEGLQLLHPADPGLSQRLRTHAGLTRQLAAQAIAIRHEG